MICVIATIEVAPGRREDFLKEFRKVVPLVREEEGCIEYAPMIDLPTNIGAQAQPQDSVVVVLEKWDSVEALESHLIAHHMVEYRKRVRDLVVNGFIRVLEPV